MQNSHVDAMPLPEFFWSADNQRLFLVDNPADIVGDPSRGKGGVGAALENDNLQFRIAAFGLRGGAHPCCIAADDNQSGCAHLTSSIEQPAMRLKVFIRYPCLQLLNCLFEFYLYFSSNALQ